MKCCNPFEEKGHTRSGKLRNVNAQMCLVSKNVEMRMKICDTCRIKLRKRIKNPVTTQEYEPHASSMPGDRETKYLYVDPHTALNC